MGAYRRLGEEKKAFQQILYLHVTTTRLDLGAKTFHPPKSQIPSSPPPYRMPSFELEVRTFNRRYNRLHNMISTPSPSPDQKDIVGQHTRYVGVNIPPTLLQKIVRLGAIVKTFNRTRSISSTPKRNVLSSLFLTRSSSLEISQLPTPRWCKAA